MKTGQREWILLCAAVCGGLLAGSVVPGLLKMGSGTYAGLLSQYSLSRYQEIHVSGWELFTAVFQKRLSFFLFLWMSSYTVIGLAFHGFCLFVLASAAGLLLAVFLLQEGYEGVLLFFCCLMPQWMLYLAAWREELLFLFRRRTWKTESLLPGNAVIGRYDLAVLGKILTLCLLGCGVECFLGTWTMKIFLQYFH